MSTPKKTDICSKLRRYLREYTLSTSIHGLHYVTEKRSRGEKLFWAAILVASLTGCVWMIFEILHKYKCSPIVVSFATRDTPIYEVPFPSVTICPETKCEKDKFNYTDVYLKYMADNTTVRGEDLKYFHYLSLLCERDPEDNITSESNEMVGEDFFTTIDKLKPEQRMYCDCSDKNIKCEDFLTPIITDVGICYSYNIMDRSKLYRDHVVHYSDFHRIKGNHNDFDLQYGYKDDVGVYSYPLRALVSGAENAFNMMLGEHILNDDYACSKYFQGFRVSVHSPVDIPRLSNHYFRIPYDKTVVVAVQPKLITTSEAVKKFKPEIRECYMSGERYLQHFKIYTQENCMLECVTNHTLNACGCVSFYMPRNTQTAVCGIANEACVEKARSRMKITELQNKISGVFKKGETHCDCKPSCTNLRYNVETSQGDFYWKEYYSLFDDFGTSADNNGHISVLSIYLKSEQFMTLERNELYGVSDLIANFGGLLGLFTGFSLISLAELVYFLTLRIFCNDRMYSSWSGPA